MGDNGATNHHHHHRQRHQLQTALARVLDELGPKRKHFWNASVKISSEQLRKVEKIKPFGYSRAPKKNAIYHSPRPGEIDPYGNNKFQKGVSLTNKKTCTHTKAKLQIEICFHRFCVH